MLEFNKYVYIVENLPYLGLRLTHILTERPFSERESLVASERQGPFRTGLRPSEGCFCQQLLSFVDLQPG